MYCDQIETWYDVYKSDLKNVFCHHYIAYLANFRTKNRDHETMKFLYMTMKFLECIHIFVLSWKRDLTKRDCNLKTTQITYYSISTSFLGKVWTLSHIPHYSGIWRLN